MDDPVGCGIIVVLLIVWGIIEAIAAVVNWLYNLWMSFQTWFLATWYSFTGWLTKAWAWLAEIIVDFLQLLGTMSLYLSVIVVLILVVIFLWSIVSHIVHAIYNWFVERTYKRSDLGRLDQMKSTVKEKIIDVKNRKAQTECRIQGNQDFVAEIESDLQINAHSNASIEKYQRKLRTVKDAIQKDLVYRDKLAKKILSLNEIISALNTNIKFVKHRGNMQGINDDLADSENYLIDLDHLIKYEYDIQIDEDFDIVMTPFEWQEELEDFGEPIKTALPINKR